MSSSVEVNGPLIERLRKTRACLSRREAARRLGMSETALYYIERGKKGKYSTQVETLPKIADLLGVGTEQLVPVGPVGPVRAEVE